MGLLEARQPLAAAHLSEVYKTLDEWAAGSIPGCRGLLFLPYVHGAEVPAFRPNATGAFLGLRPEHDVRDLARAVLEGVSLGLREIVDVLQRRGVIITRLSLTGGGGRSRQWPRILASVLDRPLELMTREVSALGAAMLGAVASGIHPSLQTAVRHMAATPERVVEPEPAWTEAYKAVHTEFRRALAANWRVRLDHV
ncbi:xylulokinase [Geochorda subterranea]|uniref:FGGY-family carbohydrate kinase n=1 Tax=Geochorda subterranea TaxID=3109564 RepID=A0ABZ1BSE2_9FIRM|nr:FGGY-family carbohydrate kinase [Limnochorda sp. LNt]WRP15133.1 FGGY-family carbohydrate kinase [Limnochorda sp. LNt]